MRSRPSKLLVVGCLALAACSEQDVPAPTTVSEPATRVATTVSTEALPRGTTGTKIVARRSEFGSMLFNARRQAIYIFQRDSKRRSNCYGACAKAWPPVYTKGRPRAGKRVRPSLLGTITRRNGRRQVTYAGKPLYYYAHEGPGQVLCHNVNLNGGLWLVVGPNGRRRP
jgi:predicted lipoprotein with Yx(FWY)xxD motif